MVQMEPYKDENLIYTFHFYEPFVFTHQGATWTGKELMDLEGLPFPYDKKRMPKLKGNVLNSWIESDIKNLYPKIGTPKFIEERMKKAADWAKKNKVNILCGEIGAKVWTNKTDRIAWINATTSALTKYQIPYCTWGIDSSDGFLKTEDLNQFFPDDIDEDVVKAYGFSMPDTKLAKIVSSKITLEKGNNYLIYNGLTGKKINLNLWGSISQGIDKETGRRCTVSAYTSPNAGITFALPDKLNRNIEKIHDNVYLTFKIKFTEKNLSMNVHFMDSDGGEELPPWRKTFTVNAADYPVNEWIDIEVPVTQLYESGAWSDKAGQWFNPRDEFDWSRFVGLFFDFDNLQGKYKGTAYLNDIEISAR